MRSFRSNLQTIKHRTRPKFSKKKYSRRPHYIKGVPCANFSSSSVISSSLNECLRVHKTRKNNARRSWKVVPKDSCEVYKNRQRRLVYSESNSYDEASSDKKEDDNRSSKTTTKRPARKYKKHMSSSTATSVSSYSETTGSYVTSDSKRGGRRSLDKRGVRKS